MHSYISILINMISIFRILFYFNVINFMNVMKLQKQLSVIIYRIVFFSFSLIYVFQDGQTFLIILKCIQIRTLIKILNYFN